MSPREDKLDLQAWISISNNTSKSYANSSLVLGTALFFTTHLLCPPVLISICAEVMSSCHEASEEEEEDKGW